MASYYKLINDHNKKVEDFFVSKEGALRTPLLRAQVYGTFNYELCDMKRCVYAGQIVAWPSNQCLTESFSEDAICFYSESNIHIYTHVWKEGFPIYQGKGSIITPNIITRIMRTCSKPDSIVSWILRQERVTVCFSHPEFYSEELSQHKHCLGIEPLMPNVPVKSSSRLAKWYETLSVYNKVSYVIDGEVNPLKWTDFCVIRKTPQLLAGGNISGKITITEDMARPPIFSLSDDLSIVQDIVNSKIPVMAIMCNIKMIVNMPGDKEMVVNLLSLFSRMGEAVYFCTEVLNESNYPSVFFLPLPYETGKEGWITATNEQASLIYTGFASFADHDRPLSFAYKHKKKIAKTQKVVYSLLFRSWQSYSHCFVQFDYDTHAITITQVLEACHSNAICFDMGSRSSKELVRYFKDVFPCLDAARLNLKRHFVEQCVLQTVCDEGLVESWWLKFRSLVYQCMAFGKTIITDVCGSCVKVDGGSLYYPRLHEYQKNSKVVFSESNFNYAFKSFDSGYNTIPRGMAQLSALKLLRIDREQSSADLFVPVWNGCYAKAVAQPSYCKLEMQKIEWFADNLEIVNEGVALPEVHTNGVHLGVEQDDDFALLGLATDTVHDFNRVFEGDER